MDHVQDESVIRVIHAGEVQVGKYNVPTPFPARSVREESISSPISNIRTAVHVDWARNEPVSQSIHRDESSIRLLNETVDRNDFRKISRSSAGPRFVCVDRVRLEHPTMANHHALQTHKGPSIHSVHAEEVLGENQNGTITRIGIQKPMHGICSIMENESLEPASQTACADQTEVKSCDNTTKWNPKRKRRIKTTAEDKKGGKGGLSSSSEEIHRTCSNMQPECIRSRNPIQQPASSPNENQLDPAGIDRIITRLCPSELPQKRASQS